MDRTQQLDRLLNPRSVGIVGASTREGNWGRVAIDNLLAIGFGGAIYPVNPHKTEVAGMRCYPTLDALPESPDMAVIALPAAAVPEMIDDAIAASVPTATVYASGFGVQGHGEGGDTRPDSPRARLHRALSSDKIAVLGPNCLGLVNYVTRAALWGNRVPLAHAGAQSGAAVIAQSGNMAMTLAAANRGFALTHLISCGNQADVTVADLIGACVRDPAVKVIATIIEGVANPPSLRTALEYAANHGKPVVVLKVGQSSKGKAAALAHTGTLSGEPSLYRALFRQSGAIQVNDLDELVSTVTLLSTTPKMRAAGVAVFANSGGECGLVADLAESVGLPLPELPDACRDRIAKLLPTYARVSNPLDLTAGGWGNIDLYRDLIVELGSHDDIDTIIGIHDAPTGEGDQLEDKWRGIVTGLGAGANAVGRDDVVVANVSTISDLRSPIPRAFAAANVAPLVGLRPALSALSKIDRRARHLERCAPAQAIDSVDTSVPANLIAGLLHKGLLREAQAKDVLDALGIRTPRRQTATSVSASIAAADAIGYPVVAKISSSSVTHKSDIGGVVTRILDEEAMAAAARHLLDLASASAPEAPAEILIEQFMPVNIELIVGAHRDAQFGPVVMVGSGGVLAEMQHDVTHRLAPFSGADATEMLDEIVVSRLLAGYRGAPPVDTDALIRIMLSVSRLMIDAAEVSDIDINPLGWSVAEQSFIALDALIVAS